MIGIIKISNNVWGNKKLKRALLRVIKPLRIEEELYYDILTIKAESELFTEITKEGSILPVYELVFKSTVKKIWFLKFQRIVFKECKVVKRSNIIPAAPVMSLKQQRDKFLKRS